MSKKKILLVTTALAPLFSVVACSSEPPPSAAPVVTTGLKPTMACYDESGCCENTDAVGTCTGPDGTFCIASGNPLAGECLDGERWTPCCGTGGGDTGGGGGDTGGCGAPEPSGCDQGLCHAVCQMRGNSDGACFNDACCCF